MIKLWLFPQDAEHAIPIAYGKESELQKGAETSPQHIFFIPEFLDSARAMQDLGWSEAEIARWFNMRVTELRVTLDEEKRKRYAEVQ